MPVNPKPTFYKRVNLTADSQNIGRVAFSFDSFLDLQRFISETEKNVEDGSKAKALLKSYNKEWIKRTINEYGKQVFGTTDADLVTSQNDVYLFNNLVDNYLGSLRQRTVNLDITDLDQSKNIKFTSKEVGIFSFDLASLGLIKVFEFYSPLLQKLVKPNNVYTEKNEDGTTVKDSDGKPIFFHKFKSEIPEHQVIWNAKEGGYFSTLLGMVIPTEDLIVKEEDGLVVYFHPYTPEIQKHIVERRQKIGDNGKPLWATTFKKVFIEIPKVEKPLPRVDIIITASYAWGQNAETELVWSSMAAIALAEKLSKANVNYRLIVAFASQTSSNPPAKRIYSFITLKKEGEPLDRNKIGLMVSDGRIFRYLGFRAITSFIYDAGFDSKLTLGGLASPLNDAFIPYILKNGKYVGVTLTNTYDDKGNVIPYTQEYDTEKELENSPKVFGNINRIKNAYIDFLKTSNNPADKEAAKNKSSKIVFSGAFSQEAAVNQYNLVIDQISKIK